MVYLWVNEITQDSLIRLAILVYWVFLSREGLSHTNAIHFSTMIRA